MSTKTYIIADFSTRLASQINIGDIVGTLALQEDSDEVNIPDGRYFFTLDGGNNLKEYIYCLKTGTALTDIYHVSEQGVKTAGTIRVHRYGSTVEITNFAYIKLLNDILNADDTLNAANPLIYDSVVAISTDKYIGTKTYADSLSITTPLAKASTTVRGRAKISAAPISPTIPIAVGTNDPRLPTQSQNDALAGTGTPSGSNKFVTADNSARLNNVDLAIDQSVGGVKTFTSIPILPASNPTTDNQLARKAYVDSLF